MLYAITHYGEGDSKLDHVMLQAATPFARIDIGCDPNALPLARTVCPDVEDLDQHYVGNQIDIITASTHVQSCMGSPTASELQTLASQSIVSAGEQTTFTKTSISAFYCQRSPNLTIAGGTYFFGADNTNIATNLKTPSYNPDGSLRCAAGEACRPQIVCAPLSSSCNGESVERDPEIFDQMVADMKLNCIPRHSAPSHHRPPHPPPPPSPPAAEEKDPCDDACGPNRRCVQVTAPPVPSWGCFDD